MKHFYKDKKEEEVCRSCGYEHINALVDLGCQPPSNRFESEDNVCGDYHSLTFGQCPRCGFIQLINPMPPGTVMSRYKWVAYREPESHLNDVADRLSKLPDLDKTALIRGITYKDDSTLSRLKGIGFKNTYRYDKVEDLGLIKSCAALESIQEALTPETVARILDRRGKADLLSVRHLLEHAHNPLAFLHSIRQLVWPGGYLWFEVPECSTFFKACDYSFIWEEHITYFSTNTLKSFFRNADMNLVDVIAYPNQYEDSLVCIARNEAWAGEQEVDKKALEAILKQGQIFSDSFNATRERIHAVFKSWKELDKRVAVFGAGHLAAKFINFFGLSHLVECVFDDHPSKVGLLMPGSRVPIRNSETLSEMDICLLSLSPESEKQVMAKHQSYRDHGGRFLSIFANNEHSIYSEKVS